MNLVPSRIYQARMLSLVKKILVQAMPGRQRVCVRIVVALNAYYSGLKREQQLYRYLLGNGATRAEAQAPFIKQAIIKSFSPLIANIAVMGLVALPGTMIGQILGGSSPNIAIKYQMMIMVITFTASMLSLMITISLASRKSFDVSGKLLEVMIEKREKKKNR